MAEDKEKDTLPEGSEAEIGAARSQASEEPPPDEAAVSSPAGENEADAAVPLPSAERRRRI